MIGILLGGLEGDIEGAPEARIVTGSKVNWYDIVDAIPQFETWPESEAIVRWTTGQKGTRG